MKSFGAFGAVVSALFVAPCQAWVGQRGPKEFAMPSLQQHPTKGSAIPFAELGRQAATLGFGCFLAAATAFGTVSPAIADAGRFSYDPNLGGPETWSTLAVEGNQCSGMKQSPIAIRPTACNVGANYEMKVRHKLCWRTF
jgi:hypothetical protein